MKLHYCLILLLPLTTQHPAAAQSYHSSSGRARVINQSSNGLDQPSSSYIGSGTMSKSAQGYNSPSTVANPGLPGVNMGANIRTPGDNLYRPKQTNNNNYYQAPRRAPANNAPQQYYYQPGQNNQTSTYRRSPSGNYTPGTATYAEQGYSGEGSTHRY